MIMRATAKTKADLLERTDTIITTLGERGALISTKADEVSIPAARPSRVSDPTGAGDSFRAGLIKGLVTGKSLLESARMGSVAASFGVECQGTQCHRFTVQEFLGPLPIQLRGSLLRLNRLREGLQVKSRAE